MNILVVVDNAGSHHLSDYISYASLVISLLTYIGTRYTTKRFARYEYIKKQMQVVIDLVSYLNSEIFEVRFSSVSESSSTGTVYRTNIFELRNLENINILRHFRDKVIVFSRSSNQLLDLKNYINNPFIPNFIADELTKFYSINNADIISPFEDNELVIIIHSNTFEETDFQRINNMEARFREPSAFAFENFENLVECSKLLQRAIVLWLERYKVKQINIRSILWREE